MKKLQHAFYMYNFDRYEMCLPNVYIKNSCEMDLLGIRKSGFIDEIEIKMSKSDFNADFKKLSLVECEREFRGKTYPDWRREPKHDLLLEGTYVSNYFSFLMSVELADKCEIPKYAGLYTYSVSRSGTYIIREVKVAPRLHSNKIDESLKYQLGRKMAFKYWDTIKS